MSIDELVRKRGAAACIGCGRCTYSCIAAQRYETFTPRTLVESALAGRRVDREPGFWACTECGACSQFCNADVDFPGLVRVIRSEVRKQNVPMAAHHGVLNRIAGLSSSKGLEPRAARWVTPDLKLDEASETLLFVGCTPYFDVVLRYIRPDLLEIPRSSVRLLNAMGVRPRLLASERCCGHDAYWLGDDALFEKLARENIEAVEKAGVKEILTFCPECMVTWRDLYPKVVGKLDIKVRSVAEAVAEGIADGRMRLKKGEERITYQDPCRFSKGAPIVEQPRQIIRSIGQLRDMPRSGSMSACCGTAGWVNCDHTAKKVQKDRLDEAAGTGAAVLVTACPKCLIHLSCTDAHHGAELSRRLKVEDLHVRTAQALEH